MVSTRRNYTTGGILQGTVGVNAPNPLFNGKGIPGLMPRSVQLVDKTYDQYENIRFTLVNAWNTNYKSQLNNANLSRISTPFRAVNNSGDLLCRTNYTCGGSTQTPQSRPGMHGLSMRFGAIRDLCDNTNVPPSACNTKFVYDSSDYTTYKKQSSFAKNYNDLTFGGDDNYASQTAIRQIRRR